MDSNDVLENDALDFKRVFGEKRVQQGPRPALVGSSMAGEKLAAAPCMRNQGSKSCFWNLKD